MCNFAILLVVSMKNKYEEDLEMEEDHGGDNLSGDHRSHQRSWPIVQQTAVGNMPRQGAATIREESHGRANLRPGCHISTGANACV